MSNNLGIVAANPIGMLTEIIKDNFLEEWHELTPDSNVVCVLKNMLSPQELYFFVTHNDIAVLFIASDFMLVHTDENFDVKQFKRNLESVCSVFWQSDN